MVGDMVDRKALLESEKAELEAILKEIPEDDFLVRPGLGGRLKEIDVELQDLYGEKKKQQGSIR